jgi:uncharacterized protein YecE (DUF72 family)
MIRIGCSGWSYEHWRGVLYHGTQDRLTVYAQHFGTVELNGSFYRWPRGPAFTAWRERMPPGFTMSVKAPRGLTHARRLRDPEVWAGRIREGVDALGPHFGVLLAQLHPDLERDDDRLAHFLSVVPHPVTVEFRHDSWLAEPVFELLERHGAAYCVMSGAHLPCVLRATAPFVYLRLHGPDHEHLYQGSYSDDDLRWWAERIREWDAQGRDVWAYFNNDLEGHAVRNAQTLAGLLTG